MKNQLLQQAQAAVEKTVTDKERFSRLVSAGTKTIYDKGTFEQLSQSIVDSETPVEDIARGIVSVLAILAHKARGTVPHEVMLQAGMVLVFDALDFAEQAGLIKVDEEALNTATTEFIEAMMPSLGFGSQKLGDLMGQLQQAMNDPKNAQAFVQSIGARK